MDTSGTTDLQGKSKVSIKLLDPLGKAIPDLKYQIKEEVRIVAKGVTDKQGRIRPFISNIGTLLTLYVESFSSGEMKKVKTMIPWAENFSVKVLSGKIKQEIDFFHDRGDAGSYKRKTCTAKENDTLLTIAAQHGTSAELLAALNGMTLADILSVGQVIKLPCDTSSSGAKTGEAKKSTPDTIPTPAGASSESGEISNDSPTATDADAEARKPAAKDQSASAHPSKEDDRGENGTPKSTLNLVCDQSGCLKIGDTGPLIEEINIRLSGFGGTLFSPKKFDEFTEKTEQAIKQFQRDYMGVTETGKICGSVLRALDDFLNQYPINLADMKCPCGKCKGFGQNFKDSSEVGMYKANGKPIPGIEHPGIHRYLLWGFRAALFYTKEKDKSLGYSFTAISSGYRCWHRNIQKKRPTINHLGNALDIQFRLTKEKGRCTGKDLEFLKEKIFKNRLGAQADWGKSNVISLEPIKDAPTWIHMDVRML